MTEILAPISILDYGSTYLRLSIYDKKLLSKNLFFEEKLNFTREKNIKEDQKISNIIIKAEKELGNHLNEVYLMIDSPSIYSLDISIKKNYDKKIISNKNINYLINECENEVKINNKEKDILHIEIFKIFLDDSEIKNLKNISQEATKINIELKFILINSSVCDELKKIFLKKHISFKNIFCTSYIKSKGLIKNLDISGYNAFIDIGLKKSSLTIFEDNKLIYINNTHIGGDHITRDISKILNIDYRTAESKKLKFYKKKSFENILNENELLKKIINSRLEEIVEILFLNCPFIKERNINSSLNLFFVGNGSKVLNENLLSFGPEFNFIKEMSIIEEKNYDCCNTAAEFSLNDQKIQPQKPLLNVENVGFFEKLFNYFK